jgi:hypothetical protein
MRDTDLYGQILGLQAPWSFKHADLDVAKGRMLGLSLPNYFPQNRRRTLFRGARQGAGAGRWKSSLHTRQGELLAERQGCHGQLRIQSKLKAKRWPDEQAAHRGGAAGSAGQYLRSLIFGRNRAAYIRRARGSKCVRNTGTELAACLVRLRNA